MFPDAIRGYKNGTLGENELMTETSFERCWGPEIHWKTYGKSPVVGYYSRKVPGLQG